MNFYKHNIGDYDAHTLHLTWAQDLAYRRLLSVYYLRERPLPADLPMIYRLCRCSKAVHQLAVRGVLEMFFTVDPITGEYRNARADKEIQQYQARTVTNRLNAASHSHSHSHTESPTESQAIRERKQKQITDTDKGSNKHRDLPAGWWSTESGIEATAKTLGINLGTKTYHELKQECFEKINGAKGNGKAKTEPKPAEMCSQCGGSLANGWTSMQGGRACNPCYAAYLGQSTPPAPAKAKLEDLPDDIPF